MTDRRRMLRWAATSTRLVLGAAIAAAVVLAVVLGVAAPWPTLETRPAAVEVTPGAADTVAACTGGLLALGRNPADAAELSSVAPQAIVQTTDADDVDTLTLPASPQAGEGSAATALVAAPVDGVRADIAAAGSTSAEDADLRGYAASACRTPLLESWLVGGATTTGSSDLIVLANPGEVPATVDLTVYGVSGAQTPPGAAGIVVAAGTRKIVPLASVGVGEEAPVVRVTASGAPIAASLQASLTRTLLAGGVDQTGAIAAASEHVVIPGVTVTPTAVAAAEAGATTRVRMLSALADTTATLTVTSVGGARVSSQDVPLTAGVPIEAGLSGLPQGTYTVTVTADTPVVAAAWQTTGFGQGADFAWYAAAPEISADVRIAVPDGPSPELVLTAGEAPVEVELEPLGDGDTVRVTVAAGSSASVSLVAGNTYRLGVDAPVHAAVSLAGDGAIAGFPVWPAAAAATVFTVFP